MSTGSGVRLTPDWRTIAECVDRYEVQRGSGFPPLRPFVQNVEPAQRVAALSELARVEMELRVHQANEKPRWGVEVSARIVDAQDRVASSLLEQESAGFTTYDLRSFWQATHGLLLVAGVENFTDNDYHEHLDLRTGHGVFQPGVNFYFGLELNY